jgi:hypothetical protein
MITCTVCGEELPFGGAFMVNTAMVLEGRSVMFVKADNITYPEEGGNGTFEERATEQRQFRSATERQSDRATAARQRDRGAGQRQFSRATGSR